MFQGSIVLDCTYQLDYTNLEYQEKSSRSFVSLTLGRTADLFGFQTISGSAGRSDNQDHFVCSDSNRSSIIISLQSHQNIWLVFSFIIKAVPPQRSDTLTFTQSQPSWQHPKHPTSTPSFGYRHPRLIDATFLLGSSISICLLKKRVERSSHYLPGVSSSIMLRDRYTRHIENGKRLGAWITGRADRPERR